jgi:hypothetical protein
MRSSAATLEQTRAHQVPINGANVPANPLGNLLRGQPMRVLKQEVGHPDEARCAGRCYTAHFHVQSIRMSNDPTRAPWCDWHYGAQSCCVPRERGQDPGLR